MFVFFNENLYSPVSDIVLCLQVSLMSSLKEDSWIPISASLFNLQLNLFWLEYMNKIQAQKSEDIFVALPDSCGYSPLTMQENSRRGIFVRISCHVDFTAMSSTLLP